MTDKLDIIHFKPDKSFYDSIDILDGYLTLSDGNDTNENNLVNKNNNTCERTIDSIQDLYNHEFSSKDLPVIRFKSLDAIEGIDAIFTTRLGGVSTEYLSGLNLGFSRGDTLENVRENYSRVARYFETDLMHMYMTNQVHKTDIGCIDDGGIPDMVGKLDIKGRIGSEAKMDPKEFPELDGIYTRKKGVVLSATFADCVPIYLVNKNAGVIATVHSGWKGTVGKIGAKAIGVMGGEPADYVAVIGPSISQKNYEVTSDVIEQFKANYTDEQMRAIAYQTDDIHYQLDLWAACYIYLKEAGVKTDNIHISGICTYDNHELLFSHRYTGGKRGNVNAFMMMK